MYSLYEPVRVAAALARQRIAAAAAARWAVPTSSLTLRDGIVTGPSGQSATYGSLSEAAASQTTVAEEVTLKADSARTVVGKGQRRTDAVAAVTGRKKFAMDLKVPGALPTMVCRPPTLKGTVRSVDNLDAGEGDAGRHARRGDLDRRGRPGAHLRPVRRRRPRAAGRLGPRHRSTTESNASVAKKLAAAELPLVPAIPGTAGAGARRSPSTSAAAPRWRPTARSRTSVRTPRRSGAA